MRVFGNEFSVFSVVANRNRLLSLLLLTYLILFVNLGPWWYRATLFGQSVTAFKVSCGCSCHEVVEFSLEHGDQGGAIQAPPCNCPICKFFKQYQVTIEKHAFTISARIENQKSPLVLKSQASIPVSHSARGPPSRI